MTGWGSDKLAYEMETDDESFVCDNNKHQFNKKPSASWITNESWDIITGIKTPLIKEEHIYNERYECNKCPKYKYVEITEEEFAKKYPEKYLKVMNNYKNNMENK